MTSVQSALQSVSKFGAWMVQVPEEIHSCAEWLLNRGPIKRTLEIGSHAGGSTVFWCELTSKLMISIDLPDGTFGGQSPVFCEDRNNRIKSLYPQFVGVLANSQNLSTVDVVRNLLDGEKLDLLFIDGDHKYDGVKSDFELYRDFVKPGGVILFHDIEDTDYHRFWNVEVSRLWKELQGEKYEFTIHSHWCGLGALVV